VRERKDGRIVLIAGLHRLEATKMNGEKEIDCIVSNEVKLKRPAVAGRRKFVAGGAECIRES